MSEDKKDIMVEIGGLWEKQDKNGNPFYAGKLSGNIVIFKNNFKEKDNQPDYKMYAQPYKKKEDSSDSF